LIDIENLKNSLFDYLEKRYWFKINDNVVVVVIVSVCMFIV